MASVFELTDRRKRKDAAPSEVKVLLALARTPLSWSELSKTTGLSPEPLARALRALSEFVWNELGKEKKWALLTPGFSYLQLLERNRKAGRLHGDDRKRLDAYMQLCPESATKNFLDPLAGGVICIPLRGKERARQEGTAEVEIDRIVTYSGVVKVTSFDSDGVDRTMLDFGQEVFHGGKLPSWVRKCEVYYGEDISKPGDATTDNTMRTRCANCGGKSFDVDNERGETTCKKCGTVISSWKFVADGRTSKPLQDRDR